MGSTIVRDGRTPLRPATPPLANRETFDTFTPAAREAISRAHVEAHALGRGYVGTEHLVLALIADDNGAPGVVHVRRGAVMASITRLTGRPGFKAPDLPPMTPVLRRVLAAATAESRRMADPAVRPEHMLIAVAEERTCMGARVLADVGIEAAKLRQSLRPNP